MSFNSFSQFGPSKTSPFLKNFILSIGAISLGISLLMILFKGFFQIHPQLLLGLSAHGIKSGYLFQIFTYSLIQLPTYHLDTSYLFSLFFNLYIIWLTVSGIIERVGIKKTISFVVSSIFCTAAFALAIMSYSPYGHVLSGNTTLLYSLAIGWLMLNPNAEISLFFVIRLQAKYLITGILGFHLLLSLSDGHTFLLWTYLFSALFAYLYTLTLWNLHSPFSFLQNFEKKIQHLKSVFKKKNNTSSSETKIYDFSTGEPLVDDEKFVDDMLVKINRFGRSSLSPREEERLETIRTKNNL